MMMFQFDEEEVRKAIALFHPAQPFEIRLVEGKWNSAGVFCDADTLIQALKTSRIRPGANVYMTLNRLNEACYDRKHRDKFIELITPTVGDGDIDAYEWLLVDVDPKRVSGTSSTREQVVGSRETAKKILIYLKNHGWADPVVAHSGNGTHLLYKIALLNTPDNKTLIQNALKALNMLFSDDQMDIDLTTFNQSRICKLYGTIARKGSSTEKRPHRMSKILLVPDEIKEIAPEFLKDLVAKLPQNEAPQQYNKYNPENFDVQEWLDNHGVEVREKTTWKEGTKWILDHCPFNPQHNHKDAAVFIRSDGKICFHCFHSSCADKGWKDFRMFYEPDAYEQKKDEPEIPNYKLPGSYRQPMEQKLVFDDGGNVKPDAPVFRTTEEIRNRPAPNESFIKTGINGIDDRMRGLKKGFVTILSGLRSAGKSSILSQMVVQCRQQGMKCALFSGEMVDKQVLRWLTQQAAGHAHVHGTQYERIFYANEWASEAISKWLDGFVYVYNNDYGTKYTEMEKYIVNIVQEKKLDLVLLDNLMMIDIENLDREMYVRQAKFVEELKRMAERLNIHIVLVAHPKKSNGYLRVEDVAGSGDMTNKADNIFIIHRVDDDYRKRTQEFYGWKSSNPLYEVDNVIEICKDRDNGYRDVHVPLWFEVETKRLKNSQTEYIHYGWEDEYQGDSFIEVDIPDEELPWSKEEAL